MLNHLSIAHDSRLCKPCISSNLLTPSLGQQIHREHDFHSIVYTTVCSRLLTVCWHFHTYINGKTILETRGDRVIMGLCQIGPRYLSFFSILFYQFYGWVLYTSVTYTHMYTVVYFTMLILFSVVFCIFYKAILLPFILSVYFYINVVQKSDILIAIYFRYFNIFLFNFG